MTEGDHIGRPEESRIADFVRLLFSGASAPVAFRSTKYRTLLLLSHRKHACEMPSSRM
jgi:hypothetical protein